MNKSNDQVLTIIAGTPDKALRISGLDIDINCYVLSDETRVLSQTGFANALNVSRRGMHKIEATRGIPRFLSSRSFLPLISKDLINALNSPIVFQNPVGGRSIHGYPATILPEICELVMMAKHTGRLTLSQENLAHRCEVLLMGLARVGILGLVDEVTGYQSLRVHNSLRKIIEKFVAEELQPWTKTFPEEFYREIFRLRGWPWAPKMKNPSVIGHYTNDIVYARLAPGVLNELKTLNPTNTSGNRLNKHHQWLNPEIGHPKLKEHLHAVIAIMKLSHDWAQFQTMLANAFPKFNDQYSFNLQHFDEGA